MNQGESNTYGECESATEQSWLADFQKSAYKFDFMILSCLQDRTPFLRIGNIDVFVWLLFPCLLNLL